MKYIIKSGYENRYLVLPTKYSEKNTPHDYKSWVIRPYLICTIEEIQEFERFHCAGIYSLYCARVAKSYSIPRFMYPIDLEIVRYDDINTKIINILSKEPIITKIK